MCRDKTWTFTYTDCANQTYTYVVTYTIDPPVVDMPDDPAAVHVACAVNATLPTPPVVTDNCGRTLSVSAGVPSADPTCAGDKTWTFTYTDCANQTYTYVVTYTIDPPVVDMPDDPAAVHVLVLLTLPCLLRLWLLTTAQNTLSFCRCA